MNGTITETVLHQSPSWHLSYLPPTLIALVLVALHVYHETSQRKKLADTMPGPRAFPFLGSVHLILGLKSNHHAFKRLMRHLEKYGKIVAGWCGWRLLVGLMDPRDVEVILNSQVHIDKADEYKFFRPWLGNGLLVSTGDKWRLHRKLIAPTFHMNILKSFVGIFNENSKKVIEKLRKVAGKEIDVHDQMSEATVNILLETAMGFKKENKEDSKKGFDYAMAVMDMCDVIHQRHFRVYYQLEAIFKYSNLKKIQEKALSIIHGLTKKVLTEKKEVFDRNLQEGKLPQPSLHDIINNKDYIETKPSNHKGLRDDLDDIDENDVGEKRRLAFLDLMIETSHYNPSQISDEEIKQQVDTIMFEGHDTTAAGSSFFLCLMGIHQDIQEKVLQEQLGIFGDSDREATFADTLEMKYLERVILETLRLYPPVPMIARRVNENVKLASGDYTIPAGATVIIGTYKIHRDPEIYPNPTKFDPDRFLPEKMASRHYYSYIPFSAGPRSCVGRKFAMLKLKVLLSTIVRNFKIKSNCTEKDFQLTGDIILKRADGFRVIFEPRN